MTEARALLDSIVQDRGAIPGKFEQAAQFDPAALEHFHAAYMHATGSASVLDDKIKQLVLVAVDAATYFHYGCRFHMAEALKLGATVDEITSVLRLAGLVVGFHGPLSAYPLLEEVLAERETSAEMTNER